MAVSIVVLFFIIALLYSSVGFGGGSSYIAILLMYNYPDDHVRFIALVCNIIVVLGACINYYRQGIFVWSKVLPLVLVSVPLAYLGGTISLSSGVFKLTAGLALILAAALMLYDTGKTPSSKKISTAILSAIGGCIGLLSGLIGIGGGIFLAPLLHLIKWENARLISATASFFILVNSLGGLLGQFSLNLNIDWTQVLILGLAVLIGGQIGNRLNIKKLSAPIIKRMTAILVGFVGIRLLSIYFNL